MQYNAFGVHKVVLHTHASARVTFLSIAGNSSVEECKLFSDEIDVMKKVSDGSNPHVLQMIGCVTVTFPMMLLLQFVPNGNLQDYLRSGFATNVRSP